MPKGLRNLPIAFEEPGLTHFAGMALIHAFCQRLGLKRLLQQALRPAPRARDYPPTDLLMALLYAVIVGLDRINATQILQYNGAFQQIVGLARFPDQTALRRFLRRLRPRHIRQLARLHDQLRQALFAHPGPRTSLTFDLDSVVLVVYGHAEGARVGYNPKKRGRRSYHPLLCFEAHRQEFWHGSLRPGNTVAATGAVPFLRVCLGKVPPGIACRRIRVRGDAGFFGKRIIELLDAERLGAAIVAKEYAPIKARARGCRFKKLRTGWEVGEFTYQPGRWARPHRFVVVRRPIPPDPVEAQQLTLFTDTKYAYHVLVTNLHTDAWRVWRFYAPRARIEKHIRELLYDYPLAKIPTADWIPNVAFFQLLLFAFDILHYFRRLCLPPAYRTTTLKTIRRELLVIPGQLVKAKNRYRLKLPREYHFQRAFEYAVRQIQKLTIPAISS
jgi:DDE family transposase